ncbi:aspartic peptidase domain-containing protein [Naematelia encephala]|uniref:Aspartic peptidase domain-containing protein n=1 Tax=Naematelia encephala TaxID=71784 RepID=A0A1Y2BHK9_9TREE|nr:aspartic peptidase domain-containing protein [Naematelia encephala]
MLILAVLLPGVVAQLSLPIIADTSFSLLSGELVVARQLVSWGIKLAPVSFNVQLDKRRSRRRDGLDLDDNGRGSLLHVFDQVEESAVGWGDDVASVGWGDDENVARGERGDTSWYTYVSLGSPPQSVPVLPDTGSSDLFVFGPSCTDCYLTNHTSFSPPSSTSFINGSFDWTIGYGDGTTAAGYAGTDMLSLGDVSIPVLIGVAGDVRGSSVAISTRSGIMGLGLDPLASMTKDKTNGATIFSRLVKSGKLDENVLSIRLDKGQQSQGKVYKEGMGEYTFGGIEEQYVVGGRAVLVWTSVSSVNFWGFAIDDISMGITSVLAADAKTPHRAIVDSGTSLILTSATAAITIHSHIPSSFQDSSSGIWYIPCSTSFPLTQNLFFTISGRRFGVPIEDLAWKVSDTYSNCCISGVQGGMEAFTILGDMFIKNHYVVLSYGSTGDQLEVGFGDRVDVQPIL